MRRSQSRWQRYQGYRFGVTLCAALTGSVFLVNLTLTIWASKTFGLDGGVGTIQNGNCHRTKNLSLWLHLAINVLSTTLLSASNYCMQCLSSPTRQEVNKAHAKNKWLDIGVPSVRNLREITWRRIILWWLLAITSLPLHLLYNSAVFDTLTSYEYAAFTVSKEFLTGAPFNTYNVAEPQYDELRSRLDSLRNLNSNNSLERLENKDCMLRYGSTFNSRNLDVIAVSTQSDVTNSLLDATLAIGPTESFGSYSWLCSFHHERNKEFCDIEAAVKEAQRWTVALYPIDYCLSQPVVENCRLQFSLPIMLIVIICNLVKASCMVLIVLKERSQPLVIVGDAISSFLNEPDPATKNVCLADKYFFREEGWQARKMTWLPKRHRWFRAASLTRWLFCNVL